MLSLYLRHTCRWGLMTMVIHLFCANESVLRYNYSIWNVPTCVLLHFFCFLKIIWGKKATWNFPTVIIASYTCHQVDDYSLVQFLPLDITDEDSINDALLQIDSSIQYGEDFEPKEPKVSTVDDTRNYFLIHLMIKHRGSGSCRDLSIDLCLWSIPP